MKRILIVDDNKNNRLFLNALLEDFSDENPEVTFEISEAENGKIAVEKAAGQKFDLILMDIMMPEMDGIEATKRIRENDQSVMIIAVSAAEDEERKKQILDKGAEDYIAKPVNADIFHTRLVNYFSLIDARSHHKRFNEAAVNLYSQEIYKRRLIFTVDSEDALSEFWEFYLLTDGPKYDLLSDVVRTVAAIGEYFVRLEVPTTIVAEENEQKLYLTIENIDQIDRKLIELNMLKNRAVTEYEIDIDRMSFVVHKMPDVSEPLYTSVASVEPEMVQPVTPESGSAPEAVDMMKSSEDLEVFDYMDADDLEEVEAYIGKLDSLFLLVGSSDITEDEVTEIFTYLDRIGRMMTTYTECYEMGQALSSLANDIANHIDEFQNNSSALGPMCAAFSRDLSGWLRMTFYDGSPSVNYMDDTVITNTKTISSMLMMNEAADDTGEGDLDDIFDF